MEANDHPWSYPEPAQIMGQTVSAVSQLPVAQLLPSAHDGDRVRCPLRLRFKEFMKTFLSPVLAGGPAPLGEYLAPLRRLEPLEFGDGLVRIPNDAFEQHLELLGYPRSG